MTEYTTCPQHPDVLLPVAEREAEQHFCPLCAQEKRAMTYRAQKAEADATPRSGELWTEKEDHALVHQFYRGADIDQLTAEHGRSAAAICTRLAHHDCLIYRQSTGQYYKVSSQPWRTAPSPKRSLNGH